MSDINQMHPDNDQWRRLGSTAWRASRPTSSDRKDEDSEASLGGGQLWESARCANISLKRVYKETFAMALLKIIRPAEWDKNNLRPRPLPKR